MASIGTIAGLASPMNFVGCGAMIIAGLIPDSKPPGVQ